MPKERLHIEVFRSLDSDPFAAVVIEDDSDEPPATAIVHLDGQKHEISWPRNAKLLDLLLEKGLDAPFSCREGHCGACAVLKRSGEVEMEVNDVLEQSDLDEGLILGCQSRPTLGFRRSHLRRIVTRLTFRPPILGRSTMKRLTIVIAAGLLTGGLGAAVPAVSWAASNAGDSSFPLPDGTLLEVHVTANCPLADKQCYFTVGADRRSGDEIDGFPGDLWARQTTTLRSSNRLNNLETQVVAADTRQFKEMGRREITTIYFGGGPPERYTDLGADPADRLANGAADAQCRLHRLRGDPGRLQRREHHLADAPARKRRSANAAGPANARRPS